MQPTVQFADDLKPIKSRDNYNGRGESSSVAGGIYPMRSRSATRERRGRRSSPSEERGTEAEDEDPGLRTEGDYKKRQVKHWIPVN